MGNVWEAKWKTSAELGKGGQARTYLVTSVNDGRRGALKALSNNRSEQARIRFRNEVVSLQALKSTNTPRLIDDNVEEYQNPSIPLYCVMEYIDGATLGHHISINGPMDIDTGISVALSASKTVNDMHEIGIVHRDLKPENIILSKGLETAHVVDLGLACFVDSNDGTTKVGERFSNKFLDLPETNTGSGDMRDRRIDTAALCAILYFCLTGHRPGHLLDSAGLAPHRRPSFEIVTADARLGSINSLLTKGFSLNVTGRYQTAAELIVNLEEIAKSSKTIDNTNPKEYAIRLAERLHREDRVTQMRRIHAQSELLFQRIQAHCESLSGGLSECTLSFHGLGSNFYDTLPPEYALASIMPAAVMIQINGHPWRAMRGYLVVMKGGDRVLMAVDVQIGTDTDHNFHHSPVWTEVAHYSDDPSPVVDTAILATNNWAVAAMTSIESKIFEP